MDPEEVKNKRISIGMKEIPRMLFILLNLALSAINSLLVLAHHPLQFVR
jgi:hypothetical protein